MSESWIVRGVRESWIVRGVRGERGRVGGEGREAVGRGRLWVFSGTLTRGEIV